MPRLVDNRYDNLAGKKGDKITIPTYASVNAYDVVPSAAPYQADDTVAGSTVLSLDYHKQASLSFTDKDYYAMENGSLSPAIEAAVESLSSAIHASFINEYKGVYGVVGTPGTPPFGSASMQNAVDISQQLTVQKAPNANRRMLLDPVAAGAAKMIPAFHSQQFNPNATVLTDGQLGKHLGMEWYEVQTVPTHTAGGGAGYLVNNGAGLAIGATTAAVDTGTGTLVVGDIVTFAGHTQTYAITAAHAGGAGTISFTPALRAVVADNAAITKLASGQVNLGFHKNAIAFASRSEMPPSVDRDKWGTLMDDDPEHGTGLALNFEIVRQNKQELWQLSCLWGVKLVRSELAVRLYG